MNKVIKIYVYMFKCIERILENSESNEIFDVRMNITILKTLYVHSSQNLTQFCFYRDSDSSWEYILFLHHINLILFPSLWMNPCKD